MSARPTGRHRSGLASPPLAFLVLLAFTALLGAAFGATPATAAGSGSVLRDWTYPGLIGDRDALFDVARAPDGSIYAAGISDQTNSSAYILVVKFDAGGHELWRRVHRPPGMVSANASYVGVDGGGNVVVGGGCSDGADWGVALAKWNASGFLQWTAVRPGGAAGSVSAYGLAVGKNGSVYVCGSQDGGDRAFVARYAAAADPSSPGKGRELWTAQVLGTAPGPGASAEALALDGAGNAYVSGSRETAAHERDAFLLKLSPSGSQRWLRGWDGPAHKSDGGVVIALSRGSVYLAANSASGDGWEGDAALLKYDGSGHRRWVKTWNGGSASTNGVIDLAADGKGGLLLAVTSSTPSTGEKAALIKYTSSGRRAWQRIFKAAAGDTSVRVSGLAVNAAGTAWITGYVSTITPVSPWFARRYSSRGARLWTTRWSGPAAEPRGGQPWDCTLAGGTRLLVVGEVNASGWESVAAALVLRR